MRGNAQQHDEQSELGECDATIVSADECAGTADQEISLEAGGSGQGCHANGAQPGKPARHQIGIAEGSRGDDDQQGNEPTQPETRRTLWSRRSPAGSPLSTRAPPLVWTVIPLKRALTFSVNVITTRGGAATRTAPGRGISRTGKAWAKAFPGPIIAPMIPPTSRIAVCGSRRHPARPAPDWRNRHRCPPAQFTVPKTTGLLVPIS